MIENINYSDGARFVVCHNAVDVYHLCELQDGQTLSTGQPYMDLFTDMESAIEFIPEQYRPEERE